MAKYKVEVTETLQRVMEVDADNKEQAEAQVREMYRREEIVLDEGDFRGVEFEPYYDREC